MDQNGSYESNEEHRDLPEGKTGKKQDAENDNSHDHDYGLHFLFYRFRLLVSHRSGNIDIVAVKKFLNLRKGLQCLFVCFRIAEGH